MTIPRNLSILADGVNASGVLDVASGGTGVTTSTGSGNNVLSTSPTLVTPALGTPSAIVLTNATGLGYGALPAGSVLQVINASTSTNVNQTTTTLIDTGLTATITPKFSTSKILVTVFQNGVAKNSNTTFERINLLRGATLLYSLEGAVGVNGSVLPNYVGTVGTTYLDSPATTSATTYKTQFNNEGGSGTTSVQVNGATSTITLMEIAG